MSATPALNEDQDLDQALPQIIAEYEQVTGKRLDPNANFDAISQQIDQDVRRSQSTNGTKAQKIIDDVGKCLQQFGEMVAQAASVAFGPATLCWNAISFVIRVAQSYRGVFDGFVALLERSRAFLRRLNFFLNQHKTGLYLDPHLRGPAYAILRHFLDLLKCSHTLVARKRDKLKLVLNIVLFNDDAGVSDSLCQMEALVVSFTQFEIDQILVDVKGLARYMHESAEDIQRRHGELKDYFARSEGLLEYTAEGLQNYGKRLDSHISKDEMKENLKKLRDALQLKECLDTWSNRQANICGNRTEGTATWLLNDLAFRRWADPLDLRSNKTMVIRGESGFGKSYLFSHVVSNLEDKYPRGKSQDRTYVLYYYFGEAEKDDTLRSCLGAMIYQLATLDESGKFAVAIVEACAKPAKIATAESVWDLFLATLQNTMVQGRCFLCIDGFAPREAREDRMTADTRAIAKMARQAALLQADPKGCSIRVFLTGTTNHISSIPFLDESAIDYRSLGAEIPSTSDSNEGVNVKPLKNQGDLIKVANARVQELQEVKPEIGSFLTPNDIQAIVSGVRGHYDNLESRLKQISACSSIEEVREIIEKAEEPFIMTSRTTIKLLNKSLSPDSIAQLNKLLLWVLGCRSWKTLELLQSALAFTLGKTFFLETLIRTRFSTLLTLDNQNVVTAPDRLREILSSADVAEANNITTDRAASVLHEAEVELCRRFIRNACGSYDYDRFQFEDFFNAHVGRTVSKIRLDSDEVLELTILQTCVRSLVERQDDERFSSLRKYASLWFYEHLVTVVDNMKTFDHEKNVLRDIGSSLSHLLYDDTSIDTWWGDDNTSALGYDWLFGDEGFHEALWTFVCHRGVAQGYAGDDEEQNWMKGKVVSGGNAYSLLLRVASRLAGRWFGNSLGIGTNFWSSYTIVARADPKPYDGIANPSIEEIDAYVEWAQESTNLRIAAPHWTFRRGTTYLLCKHTTEGIQAMIQAEQDGFSEWALPLELAEAYCKLKDYPAALEYCHKFAEFKHTSAHSLRLSEHGSQEPYNEAYYGRVLLREAECHKLLGSTQPAVKCYMEVLDHEETIEDAHQEALCSMFEIWRKSKDYSSVLNLFRTWRDIKEPGLFHWIMKIAHFDSVHLCLLNAAQSTASHREIVDAYKRTLKTLTEQDATDDDESKQAVNQLRYVLAAMLFHGSDLDDDHHEALDIWEALILKQNDASNSWSISLASAQNLSRSLLEKASETLYESHCQYTARLTKLAAMDHEDIFIFRQCGKDPRLSLARLQRFRGREEEARLTLRERLRNALDGWHGKDDDGDIERLAGRYNCTAHALTVIHDDINAVAAWQASEPKAKAVPDDSTLTGDTSGEQATAGAAAILADPSLYPPMLSSNVHSITEEATSQKSHDQEMSPKTRKPYQDPYYCDGACGADFDVSSNSFICRDCLDIQLCPECHTKLKNGQLSPTICKSSHDFLYVPTVDETLWGKLEADQMIVGDAVLSRDEWINGLRQEWNLKQEQIDTEKLEAGRKLKATRRIAQFVFNWKRGQKKKPTVKSVTENLPQ